MSRERRDALVPWLRTTANVATKTKKVKIRQSILQERQSNKKRINAANSKFWKAIITTLNDRVDSHINAATTHPKQREITKIRSRVRLISSALSLVSNLLLSTRFKTIARQSYRQKCVNFRRRCFRLGRTVSLERTWNRDRIRSFHVSTDIPTYLWRVFSMVAHPQTLTLDSDLGLR